MSKIKKTYGQFARLPIEMLKSPAWRNLGLTERRILDRIEIELAAHGGKDNGALPVTKGDFIKFGIDHTCIPSAQRVLEALGFIGVRRGRAGNGPYRTPNLFRLTYRPVGDTEPTDEWRQITSTDHAKSVKSGIKKTSPKKHFSGRKNRSGPGRKNRSGTGPEKPVNAPQNTGPEKPVNYLDSYPSSAAGRAGEAEADAKRASELRAQGGG
jgi:hypothetical protein